MRLRDRIGSYHKYVDNALVNNPDPTSSHFIEGNQWLVYNISFKLIDNERYNKDYAAYDKKMREE